MHNNHLSLSPNAVQCPDVGMDSFIDQDMEDEMVEDASAPGSAVKKRKGFAPRALYTSVGARAQPPIQPGATLTGVLPNTSNPPKLPACMSPEFAYVDSIFQSKSHLSSFIALACLNTSPHLFV